MGSCQSKPETNGRGHQLVSKEDQADLKQVLTAAGLADLLPNFIDEVKRTKKKKKKKLSLTNASKNTHSPKN